MTSLSTNQEHRKPARLNDPEVSRIIGKETSCRVSLPAKKAVRDKVLMPSVENLMKVAVAMSKNRTVSDRDCAAAAEYLNRRGLITDFEFKNPSRKKNRLSEEKGDEEGDDDEDKSDDDEEDDEEKSAD